MSCNQLPSHIEAPAHESAFNAAKLLAIQKHLGLPVDAVEVKPRSLLRICRRGEFGAIPEVGVEKRIGNLKLVLAKVRVGDRAHIQIRRKYRPRHRRHQPTGILIPWLRQRIATGPNQARPLQTPSASSQIKTPVSIRRRRSLRTNIESAATMHFNLAQDVSIGRCGPRHQHAHITRMRRRAKPEFLHISRIPREWPYIVPG